MAGRRTLSVIYIIYAKSLIAIGIAVSSLLLTEPKGSLIVGT